MSVNSVTLIGRLGRDPELRYTGSGDPVANVSLATTESWTKDGEKQEKTEWHNLVAFRKQAELFGKFYHKGNLVYVSGKIQYRSWEDKEGAKRVTTEIVVNNARNLSPKEASAAVGELPFAAGEAALGGNPFDDDVPF